ncbi:hypothetical protein SAMN05444008_111115 [Cnuella takakiae]|uniref:Uncharacterized protein n=1 Tax=Cnuella takakiae TaxID=1302690 RepID=A0A1M5DX11_9BACT|nr:hypothetical protein SAMN05444008_111115 [Cnuella takakiae]
MNACQVKALISISFYLSFKVNTFDKENNYLNTRI